MKRVLPREARCARCMLAATEAGPRTVRCWTVARRGGRCPVGAPTVAVGPAGRLRCASRSALARRNSLHSLRSFRSGNRRESEDEARAARVPSALLRCSPPHKSPPPGTAHRAVTLVVVADACLGSAGKAVGGQAGARLEGAEQRSLTGGIATRMSASRRRACRGPSAAALRQQRRARARPRGGAALVRRAAQGTSARRAEAPVVARTGLPARSLACSTLCMCLPHECRRIPGRGFASFTLPRGLGLPARPLVARIAMVR